MARRKTSSRNRGGTLPPDNGERTRLIEENYKKITQEAERRRQNLGKLFGKKSRERVEKARQARAEREARMDNCERYLRSWQTPPKTLFDEWLEWCVATEIDPTKRLDYLRRPLKNRLKELIGEEPRGWDDDPKAPKDRILYRFYCWDVFDGREPNHSAAELITYLEDVQEGLWRRQRRRSTWRVAEGERAEAVVVALLAIIREAELYISELTGDEPECDPRINEVRPLLREVRRRLTGTMVDPPKAEPEGRPIVGPEKKWSAKVQSDVLQRLERIRPWGRCEDDSETEHKRMLRSLSQKIIKRLGIRGPRGIGSSRLPRPRPPSNQRHALARRICTALVVKRLRSTRRDS